MSPRGDAPQITMQPWRLLILVRIGNFGKFRRQIGRVRAGRLSLAMAARIDVLFGTPGRAVAGRSTVEIELSGRRLEDAHSALDRLEAAFDHPVSVDGEFYRLDLAMAAAAGPMDDTDEVRLIEEAEAALIQAQAEHRRVVRDMTAPSSSMDQFTIGRELVDAMERDEVFLQYQPKMHVRRQQVASAEALVRWEHPTRGLILPNEFIPAAEEARLIAPLTLWTLRRVIGDQRLLRADGHDLLIFINISGQLLGDRHFIDAACALIQETGARIGFEITETSMIRDPDSAVEQLKVAAAAGIPIAIDDYGAGLSSLAYLKKLPATELKIDKMFVLDLTSSNRDPLIVRSTIDLAHAMDMEVTAEGVETPAALALLSVMGCDQVQGYLLSRPLSLHALLEFVKADAPREVVPPSFALRQSSSFWKAA